MTSDRTTWPEKNYERKKLQAASFKPQAGLDNE
jgi:hypothetical protein